MEVFFISPAPLASGGAVLSIKKCIKKVYNIQILCLYERDSYMKEIATVIFQIILFQFILAKFM